MTNVLSYAPRCLHLVLLFCIVPLLVACDTGGSTSSPGPGGNQQTPAQTSAPGVPVNVNNVNDLVAFNGTVIVAWYPSEPNGTVIDHYDVVEIHSDNTIGATVASVPASGSLSWKQTGLNLCTYYRYGVKAVTTTGEESSVAFPLHQAFTSGSLAPGYEPKTVVVMAMGVNSQITGGTMHLLSRQSYCTTYDGISPAASAPAPLQSLLDGWDNQDYTTHVIDATGPTGFGAGNRMIDSLVSRGAIVLPMSYSKGSLLTGPPAAPTFTTAGYKPDDVANTSPDQVAQWLDDELVSIHTTWPNANIIIVGHSAGGLATYLWWTQHGQYQPQGVVQAFSLDGPINGTQNSLCTHHVISWVCNKLFGIDSPLAKKVSDIWNQQDRLDSEAQIIEQKSPIFTAVGTQGDAVWDFADGSRCALIDAGKCYDSIGGDGDNNGLVSQVFHSNTCKEASYTASRLECASGAHSIVSRCGPLPDGTKDMYGLTGTLWTHSNVKNCPDVISKIVAYAYHPPSKATANENPLGKVDWTKVVTETDLGCEAPRGPGLGVNVDEVEFADVTGTGKEDAFVAMSCKSSTSSWPDVLLVFDGASDITHPQLMAILLGYHDGTDARGLQMGDLSGIPRSITISGQTVTVVSLGYVSSDPNCCPSQRVTDTFTWNGSGFTRGARSVVQAKAP